MKLSQLLSQREALLRQTRLANLAFGYARLEDFATRIGRARLCGAVSLKQASPGADRFGASLTALAGNQSVIEEHFTDEDVSDLADIIAFMTGASDLDLTFSLEELREKFLGALRRELERQGVAIDRNPPPAENSDHGNSSGCSQLDEGA